MAHKLRTWLLLPLILLLGACTTIQLEPVPDGMTDQPPADWGMRSGTLSRFDHWRLMGKLAVHQPSDSGTALINHWLQQGETYDLALSSSFLGMGSTRLKGTQGFMELTLSNGETYQSNEPEKLVEAATGWQLPLEQLTWWIRGLPAPDSDFRLLFEQGGQLAIIRQSGWEIHYDRWRQFLPDYPALPARITALKGEKRVRLVVSEWTTQDSPQ